MLKKSKKKNFSGFPCLRKFAVKYPVHGGSQSERLMQLGIILLGATALIRRAANPGQLFSIVLSCTGLSGLLLVTHVCIYYLMILPAWVYLISGVRPDFPNTVFGKFLASVGIAFVLLIFCLLGNNLFALFTGRSLPPYILVIYWAAISLLIGVLLQVLKINSPDESKTK